MNKDYENFRLRIENKLKDYCWVSHTNKVIFFVIPKNASTAIRKSPLMKGSYRTSYSDLCKLDNFHEYETFVVLRDPLERIVSAYYEVLRGHRPENIYNTVADKKFILLNNEPDRFECLLDEIAEYGFFDGHLKPQAYFVTDDAGNEVEIDNYLFFETITQDFSKFCARRGQHFILPNMNSFAKMYKKELVLWARNNKRVSKKFNDLYGADVRLYLEKSPSS
tara:strand:+ start:59 stop:724 length:666 start_codon:yes stop_codon:yes gene_type:complete